jgi:hypothetical protein
MVIMTHPDKTRVASVTNTAQNTISLITFTPLPHRGKNQFNLATTHDTVRLCFSGLLIMGYFTVKAHINVTA